MWQISMAPLSPSASRSSNPMPLPLRILLRAILNILLAWALATYLPQYVSISGGWIAYVVIGALLTLLHLLVRPLLDLLALPLHIIATLFSFFLVNGVFVWITLWIVQRMDPTVATFAIREGIVGWAVVIVVVGTANVVGRLLLH